MKKNFVDHWRDIPLVMRDLLDFGPRSVAKVWGVLPAVVATTTAVAIIFSCAGVGMIIGISLPLPG